MPVPEVFLPERVEVFSLTGFDLDAATGTVRLSYALDDLALTELVQLPPGQATAADEALLRLLWLAAAPSYYKAATPPSVAVVGGLSRPERRLLDALLGPGLGELYFVNGLDPAGPAVEAAERTDGPVADLGLDRRSLVPVGGGKDSCVTIEALQEAGEDPLLASVRRFPVIDAVLSRAGGDAVRVGRTLDPQLLELNGRGPATATSRSPRSSAWSCAWWPCGPAATASSCPTNGRPPRPPGTGGARPSTTSGRSRWPPRSCWPASWPRPSGPSCRGSACCGRSASWPSAACSPTGDAASSATSPRATPPSASTTAGGSTDGTATAPSAASSPSLWPLAGPGRGLGDPGR